MQGIYALVDPGRPGFSAAALDALLAEGIRLVQLRAKAGLDGDALDALVERIRRAGGLAIVNDDLELALRADGVHLGQDDVRPGDLPAVRARLGPRVLGLSCGVPAEARETDPALVDYIGIGPVFATPSKPDAGPPIGINGARVVVLSTPLPAAVIGGITVANVARARETGAAMCAVIGALALDDPRAAARPLVAAWNA